VLSQLRKAQPELLRFFEVGSDDCQRIVELVPEALSNSASGSAPQGVSAPPGASPDLPRAWRWRDVPRPSWGPGMYATLQGDGRPIVVGGAVYACGYNKPLALLHACTAESVPAPTHIFFIDDAPNNAYEVHRDLPGWLRQWSAQNAGHDAHQEPGVKPVLRSLWWDLFEEEFESKTIAPNTSGADFAYLRDATHQNFVYASALRHFGLSESDISERARRYEHVQQERDARQAAKRAAALDISDANVETPAASQPSVLERRRQVQELLIAHGRAPGDR